MATADQVRKSKRSSFTLLKEDLFAFHPAIRVQQIADCLWFYRGFTGLLLHDSRCRHACVLGSLLLRHSLARHDPSQADSELSLMNGVSARSHDPLWINGILNPCGQLPRRCCRIDNHVHVPGSHPVGKTSHFLPAAE